MNLFRFLKRKFDDPLKKAIKKGMTVGKGVSVISNVSFGSEPYLITLEDNVRISFDVAFVTHDGGTWAFRDMPEYKSVVKYGKIVVGERTFIGCRSVVMPGVKIGKRCVIGAGSIVTKDVPDGTVVAGNPARFIMTTEEYAEKCKSKIVDFNEEEYWKDKQKYLQKWL